MIQSQHLENKIKLHQYANRDLSVIMTQELIYYFGLISHENNRSCYQLPSQKQMQWKHLVLIQ